MKEKRNYRSSSSSRSNSRSVSSRSSSRSSKSKSRSRSRSREKTIKRNSDSYRKRDYNNTNKYNDRKPNSYNRDRREFNNERQYNRNTPFNSMKNRQKFTPNEEENIEEKDKEFLLNQYKERSMIRLKENRAEIIDRIAKHVLVFETNLIDDYALLDPEIEDDDKTKPYEYLDNLSFKELEDLKIDIKKFIEIYKYEKNEKNEYFKEFENLVEILITRLDSKYSNVLPSIQEKILDIIQNKSSNELEKLIESIENSNIVMEEDFSENVVQQAKIMLYKQKLSKLHEILLDKRKVLIKPKNHSENRNKITIKERDDVVDEEKEEINNDNIQSNNIESTETIKPKSKPSLLSPTSTTLSSTTNKIVKSKENNHNDNWKIESSDSEDDNNIEEIEYIDLPYINNDDIDSFVNPGTVSPLLLREKDIEDKTMIIDPKEDLIQLQEERRKILEKQNRVNNKESEFVMNEDDIDDMNNDGTRNPKQTETALEANSEIILPPQVYPWQDKYKPRKPLYVNRVKMGFEWNRFNQAHYDEDNPPPKVVFGYKFNIFYPDLVNPSDTPKYKVLKGETKEFCILKFISGAPYEDIAFKIINREWDYQPRNGFQCYFERGILHLFFNFKRPKYRR